MEIIDFSSEIDFLEFFENNIENTDFLVNENNIKVFEVLSEHEISNILKFLPILDVWKFAHLNKKLKNKREDFMNSVENVEIDRSNPDINKTLNLLIKYCPNVTSVRVFKFFYNEIAYFEVKYSF